MSLFQSPVGSRALGLFLGVRDRDVVFVLDVSEGMFPVLGAVKHWLVQTLLAKAALRDSLFNIVGFSYKATQWHKCMVSCGADVVYEAIGWIHALNCSPGRGLLSGLTAAFSDPRCQAVHLLTNALPDDAEAVLHLTPAMAGQRPVHIFFLSNEHCLDSKTQTFLQCLAHATRGSCHVLSLSAAGTVEQVHPLCVAESRTSTPVRSEQKYCSAGAVLSWAPSCLPCASRLHHSHRCSLFPPGALFPVRRYPGSPTFHLGSRVLARRELDGFHYLGTVREELQGRRGLYVVEFDRPLVEGVTGGVVLQLTGVLDMVPHTEAYGHSLVPSDTVLAPWETSLARYGPGTVLHGAELRDVISGQSDPGVEVLFWNGRRVLVPGGVAVWISPSLHESILGELQRPLPLCCRGDLQGYLPCPGCALCPTLLALTPAVAPPPCPLREWWHLSSTPSYANELKDTALMERKELERKVDTQLQELRGSTGSLSSSSSSSSDDEETVTDTEPKPLGGDTMKTAVSPERQKSAPLSRPAWRYWSRSHLEPQHRQPATLTRKTSKSVQVMSPGVPSDCPTNRSALFLSVPVTIGQRVTIKDVLHQTDGGPPSASSAQLQLSVTGKRVPAAQM